jgi:NADPH:quinone reductase-like Zn-dependent oxidoreductase
MKNRFLKKPDNDSKDIQMTDIFQSFSNKNRFELGNKPTMKAVVTKGNGGYDKLLYCDVPIPELESGEVLVQVLAAGVNNTEINTRLGWYSSTVTASTEETADQDHAQEAPIEDGGWNESTPFPFIQGTDCCGRIAAVGPNGDEQTIGLRVLIRPCMRMNGFKSMENIWMASDFDGAFAQYVKVPVEEVFSVKCNWSDVELGSIPCAYGTAENMLHRTNVKPGDHVLIKGASGGVGSAAVQLAKRRGAKVIAISGKEKMAAVSAIGADQVFSRDENIIGTIGEKSIDVVVDNVGGPGFGDALNMIKRGGKYVSSGAIGGPMVTLDMRTFYLKDITLVGCTAWDEPVFPNLITYIENDEIKPLIAKTFPLEQIAAAQQVFMEKKHVGKFVLVPPQTE